MKNNMKKIVRFFLAFLGRFFYGKNILVFEDIDGFDGNAYALYEFIKSDNRFDKYKLVWIVRNKVKFYNDDNRAIIISRYKDFIKRKMILGNAKCIFVDNYWLERHNNSQKLIYLGHGCPTIKNVHGTLMFDNNYDYALCTSKNVVDSQSYQISCPREKFIVCGMPRNDFLFKENKNICKIFKKDDYSKIIIWMPTFRKSQKNRVDSELEYPLGLPLLNNKKEVKAINDELVNHNILLIAKLHPVQAQQFSISSGEFSNILPLTNDDLRNNNINLYSLLRETDALLTDYSSVSFDYMLLNKQIGYILYDMDTYKLGFAYDNIMEYFPGNKIYSINDLKKYISDVFNDNDIFKKEREKVLNWANDYTDDKNTERLFKILIDKGILEV